MHLELYTIILSINMAQNPQISCYEMEVIQDKIGTEMTKYSGLKPVMFAVILCSSALGVVSCIQYLQDSPVMTLWLLPSCLDVTTALRVCLGSVERLHCSC